MENRRISSPRWQVFVVFIFLPLLVAGIMAAPAQARTSNFGLGLYLGEPTGINAKFWMSSRNSLDFTAAWSFEDRFTLTGDYQWHRPFPNAQGLLWFYGIGGFVRFSDDNGDDHLGVRVPVGIEYFIRQSPLSLFAEIALGMRLSPETEADVMGGFGLRVYL